jgi:hypothetical protein
MVERPLYDEAERCWQIPTGQQPAFRLGVLFGWQQALNAVEEADADAEARHARLKEWACHELRDWAAAEGTDLQTPAPPK